MLKKWALGVLLGAASFGAAAQNLEQAAAVPLNTKPSWLVPTYKYENPQTNKSTIVHTYQIISKKSGSGPSDMSYIVKDANGIVSTLCIGYACPNVDKDTSIRKLNKDHATAAVMRVLTPQYKSAQGVFFFNMSKKIDSNAPIATNEMSDFQVSDEVFAFLQPCSRAGGCALGEEAGKMFLKNTSIQSSEISSLLFFKDNYMQHSSTDIYLNRSSGSNYTGFSNNIMLTK